MTTLWKVLIGLVIALALILAVGLWWLSRSLGPLVASAVRTHGPEITGVSVRLDSVAIAPFSGTAELHGLVMGSPEGFHADHALSLGDFSAIVDLRSLLSNVILIRRIDIVQPDITYEFGPGGSNLQAIQRNVNHYAGAGGSSPAKEPGPQKGGGKKFVIRDLVIKEATVHVSASVMQGKALAVPLPDLHLHDIGKESNGATAGEAVKQVLGALTNSVTAAVAKGNLGNVEEKLQQGAGSAGGFLNGLMKK
jgi:uncharacterized protein involved in outer membrane biogenesis